ncbi:site-specific tyrosine recombinase XerD [Candidatus Dependentiae bacterium]|nr:site-specific tyrosine recombinase XerD [Candidatus Dependentiae bacterium]
MEKDNFELRVQKLKNNPVFNLIEEYKSYLFAEKKSSRNTIDSYELDLIDFLEYINKFKIESPENIRPSLVSEYIHKLRNEGKNEKTIIRHIVALRNFFKFLIIDNVIKNSPTDSVEMPKMSRKLPDYLTEEEVKRLIESPDLNEITGIRDKAMIEILYGSGVRVSELIGLKIKNLYLEEGYIKVFGKGSKERIIPIGKYAEESLKNYLASARHKLSRIDSEDYLFITQRGEKFTRQAINKMLYNYAIKSGIGRKVTPHLFRHTFATHLINNGADLRSVQEMLGHTDISATQIYTHLDLRYIKEVHKNFHPHG